MSPIKKALGQRYINLAAVTVAAALFMPTASFAQSYDELDMIGRYGKQYVQALEECESDKHCAVVAARYRAIASSADAARAFREYDYQLYRTGKSVCDSSTFFMDAYTKIYKVRWVFAKSKNIDRKVKGLKKTTSRMRKYAKKKLPYKSYKKVRNLERAAHKLHRKTYRKQQAVSALLFKGPGTATRKLRCRGFQ